MNDNLQNQIQESLYEWAEINKMKNIREKKDKKIISTFCAENDYADIIHTLDLLQNCNGMAQHDKEIIKNFQKNYPNELDTQMIQDFLDIKEIYREYLEDGGENND